MTMTVVAAGLTVRALNRQLEGDLAELLSAGRVGRQAVTDVCLYEPGASALDGMLVILSGQDQSRLASQIRELARRSAAGLVVDADDGAAAALGALGRRLGIAVWRRRAGCHWLDVVDAVRQAVRVPEPGPEGLGEVPPGDLTGLADALARMLGGPVVIEDSRFRLLSYSIFTGTVDRGRDQAILRRRMPAEWLHHLERTGALERLLTPGQVVDLPDGPGQARRRVVTSVTAGRQILGFVWLAEAGGPLAEDVALRIRTAARAVAPHLARHREAQHTERWERARSVRLLLQGSEVPRALTEDLGLAPAAGYVVVAARQAAPGPQTPAQCGRLTEAIMLYCDAYRWRVAAAPVGGTAYGLIALSAHQWPEQGTGLASGLARGVEPTMGCPLHIAVSQPGRQLQSVPDLRAQADEVLELLGHRAPDQSHAASFGQRAPALLVARLQRHLEQEIAGYYPGLAALAGFDAEHGTDYRQTLGVYLETFGNARLAAARLGLHRTTVLYRLRRIAEVAGVNLEDPDERLLCALALRQRGAAVAVSPGPAAPPARAEP
jgi:hypothetical protein